MTAGVVLGVVAVQGLVAAAMVEALIQLWRVEVPDQALHLRRMALALPVFVPAATWAFSGLALWPAAFTLLEVRRWRHLAVPGGLRLGAAAAAVAGISVGLFVFQEFLPALARRQGSLRGARVYRGGELPALDAALAAVSTAFAGLALPVWLAEDGGPVACVAGPWRPRLMVSRRLVALLTPPELAAALAHEAAHTLRDDLRMGWVWFGVRAVQCFSPAALLVFRWTLRDQERACDRMAAARTGDPRVLASALRKVHQATGPPPAAGAWGRLLVRARAAWEERLVDRRVSDLLRGDQPAPLPRWRWRLAASALAVGGVLALVR